MHDSAHPEGDGHGNSQIRRGSHLHDAPAQEQAAHQHAGRQAQRQARGRVANEQLGGKRRHQAEHDHDRPERGREAAGQQHIRRVAGRPALRQGRADQGDEGHDLDADGKPIRWKVENSWGTTAHGKPVGHQGYFIMDDSWFDQYMYEVAVRKEYLPEEYQKALETEPEVLPYWNTFNPEP